MCKLTMNKKHIKMLKACWMIIYRQTNFVVLRGCQVLDFLKLNQWAINWGQSVSIFILL